MLFGTPMLIYGQWIWKEMVKSQENYLKDEAPQELAAFRTRYGIPPETVIEKIY